MNLICDTTTGDNVGMGMILFEPSPDQTIYYVSFPIPEEKLSHYTFNGTDLVRKNQSVIDEIDTIDNFNTDILLIRINDLMSQDAVGRTSPYQGSLVAYCQKKNFYTTEDEPKSAESFIQWLFDNGHATADDVALIKQAFAEQGIDF